MNASRSIHQITPYISHDSQGQSVMYSFVYIQVSTLEQPDQPTIVLYIDRRWASNVDIIKNMHKEGLVILYYDSLTFCSHTYTNLRLVWKQTPATRIQTNLRLVWKQNQPHVFKQTKACMKANFSHTYTNKLNACMKAKSATCIQTNKGLYESKLQPHVYKQT